MPDFKAKLIKKEEVATGTMAFHFEKPADFEFRAGQFADLTLINPPETDAEGNRRAFSLVMAPYEPDIMFATRMRDTAFKRVLRELPLGSELDFSGPFGNYVLHQNTSIPAVFLIGGIGITPVRSMIADATHNATGHKLTLLYSDKTPADMAFLSDLKGFAELNHNLNFVPVMTRDESWTGERGHIDEEMLRRYVDDLSLPIYYISGPAPMVSAMRQLLAGVGVSEDNIRTEEFPGY